MSKKTKIIQSKNETPPETGGSFKIKAGKGNRTLRSTASRKPRETGTRKGATAGKASSPNQAAEIAEPSDEAIRLRAYFISERRRRFALPGDAESDWLEAKRQLLSEAAKLQTRNRKSPLINEMENAFGDLAQALRERLAVIRDKQSRRDDAKHIARLRAVLGKNRQVTSIAAAAHRSETSALSSAQ